MKNYQDFFKILSNLEISKTEDSIFIKKEYNSFLEIVFTPEVNRFKELNYRVSLNYLTKINNELSNSIDELEFLLDSNFNVKFSCFYNYKNKYGQQTEKKTQQKMHFRNKKDKLKDVEIFKFLEKLELKQNLEKDLIENKNQTRKNKI